MWTYEMPEYLDPSNVKYFCNYYSKILKKSPKDTYEMLFDHPAFVNLWKYLSNENKINAFYDELNLRGGTP